VKHLIENVRAAALRADVRNAVARVYIDLQREIDARRPICSASGRCCRFEEYGHRLYVSTLELAAFLAELPAELPAASPLPVARGQLSVKGTSLPLLATGTSQVATSNCPFQIQSLCSVHAIRPFGCRIFFCDPTATQWQNERYERFHAELKRLHAQLDVPYLYVEWRQALAALGLMPTGSRERPAGERAAGDLSRT
jgi:Fe-S-cluster containining protein